MRAAARRRTRRRRAGACPRWRTHPRGCRRARPTGARFDVDTDADQPVDAGGLRGLDHDLQVPGRSGTGGSGCPPPRLSAGSSGFRSLTSAETTRVSTYGRWGELHVKHDSWKPHPEVQGGGKRWRTPSELSGLEPGEERLALGRRGTHGEPAPHRRRRERRWASSGSVDGRAGPTAASAARGMIGWISDGERSRRVSAAGVEHARELVAVRRVLRELPRLLLDQVVVGAGRRCPRPRRAPAAAGRRACARRSARTRVRRSPPAGRDSAPGATGSGTAPSK